MDKRRRHSSHPDLLHHRKLPQQLKETNIVLIPKKTNPTTPMDYRPINLCNVIYKLGAKSIANRITDHLPGYIHTSQSAFIQGRSINTNIILAQEIVYSFRIANWNNQRFMIKIDLAKAFDRLEWGFIEQALRHQGYTSQQGRSCNKMSKKRTPQCKTAQCYHTHNLRCNHCGWESDATQGCPSPLQAEAGALLLASNIAKALHYDNIMFCPDNQVLTSTANLDMNQMIGC
ncbi:hypothetical protein PR202_gb07838 [Eleusine coracana subsp. coracana]|uniref:Reverse transcriptase domain-containing protein n=1 Tax=Eleusine coracana subsp. coracana TaxID=191504 RepID=A0AAV5ED60_ELECO|nr:hypothetical protein PR202_gb07838 [Eleusine coracana subsp. coracana]